MLKRIDHIGVVVADMPSARAFVEGVLGFEYRREVRLAEGDVHGVFFGLGDTLIELIEVGDPALRQTRLGGANQARIEHIAIQVDDLAATVGELRKHGVTTTRPEALEAGPGLHYWTNPNSSAGVQYQFSAPKPG